MRIQGSVLLATAVVIAAASSTARGDEDRERKGVRAVYAVIRNAWLSRSPDLLMEALTFDFTRREPNGKTFTRDQVSKFLRDDMGRVKSIRNLTYTLGPFSMKKGQITVPVTENFSWVRVDEKLRDQKVTTRSVERHKLRRTAYGWRLEKIEILSRRIVVNDKKVFTTVLKKTR